MKAATGAWASRNAASCRSALSPRRCTAACRPWSASCASRRRAGHPAAGNDVAAADRGAPERAHRHRLWPGRSNDPAVGARCCARNGAGGGPELAAGRQPPAVAIRELAGQDLIVYPKGPGPPSPTSAQPAGRPRRAARQRAEVRELQIALGMTAAEAGICIIPFAASQQRIDLHYRLLGDATRLRRSSSATGSTMIRAISPGARADRRNPRRSALAAGARTGAENGLNHGVCGRRGGPALAGATIGRIPCPAPQWSTGGAVPPFRPVPGRAGRRSTRP